MKKAISVFITHSKYDARLIFLYILNVSDYLFTLILLSDGLFFEANPILESSINGIGGFILKCIVPLILLSYLHIRAGSNVIKHEKAVNILLNIILIYYIAINVFHVFWIILISLIL